MASDRQSADPCDVKVGPGSGEAASSTDDASYTGLGEPSGVGSDADMSKTGRQGKDGLEGPPRDAALRCFLYMAFCSEGMEWN